MSQIGVVHVGIYPNISEKEYLHILSHSESRILIVSNKELYELLYPVFEKLDNLEEIYTIDQVEGAKNWSEIGRVGKEKANKYRELLEQKKAEIKPDDLLTLIYTSGTTGLSKGVMLTHNNIVSNVGLAIACVPYAKVGKTQRSAHFALSDAIYVKNHFNFCLCCLTRYACFPHFSSLFLSSIQETSHTQGDVNE